MRVGIITVHSVPNYGAVLQAYALAGYLRSLHLDACTIDYRQPQLEEMYRFRWRLPPPVNHWLRLRRNSEFVDSYLPLGPHRCRSVAEFLPEISQYDAFITGSDQVWFTGPVQFFDPMYFLEFPAPGKRKISYAASAGGTADFLEFKPRVRAALAEFDHIGVRDAHTAALVEPLSPRSPVQVVDPVFLCDFSDLMDHRPPIQEPYLLVFGDFSKGLAPVVQSVVDATGIKTVISLQYPCSAATRRIASPSPTTWLSYFRHAAFVVTSYFHGTAIAVKFERPFLAIPTPGRRIKVATLLEPLGLSRRCFMSEPGALEAAERALESIDWPTARRNLQKQVEVSKAFLRTALQ